MIKRSGVRCCDSSMIARCNPCPCPKIMTWRTTSPAPWAYTARALGVLGARRSHSPCPHRTNTAPSTTKRPTPEPHNRHHGRQRPCATQQVFAAQAKPSDQNRRTAKAEGPRGTRREHRHGRALGRVHGNQGVPTARRGRTDRSPWAYQPPAVGVPTARRGRTSRSPWAYRPLAVGIPAARPGRTRHAPWAYSPRSTIGLRGSSLHECCPSTTKPKPPPSTSSAPSPPCQGRGQD